MTKQPIPEAPPVSQCWMLPQAAELLKVGRSTLRAAIDRGDLRVWKTACDHQLVTMEDCREFLASTPGRGFKNPEVRRKAGATRGEKVKG